VDLFTENDGVLGRGGAYKKNSGPDVINLVEIDLKWFITSDTMGLVFKCS
jgi:hypothetical protein